jgi:hypothetical protein
MTASLSPAEKLTVLNNHLKNILYAEYNNKLSLLEVGVSSIVNPPDVDKLHAISQDIASQKEIIQKEIDSVTLELENPQNN